MTIPIVASVGVVGDSCADLRVAGEVVRGDASEDVGIDDEEAVDSAGGASIKHADGVTTQSVNSQAAIRVTSSRTVAMPWVNK